MPADPTNALRERVARALFPDDATAFGACTWRKEIDAAIRIVVEACAERAMRMSRQQEQVAALCDIDDDSESSIVHDKIAHALAVCAADIRSLAAPNAPGNNTTGEGT